MENINIIETVVKTEATRKNVKLMIPVLIHWAKNGYKHKTYGELIHAIGMQQYTGIGHALYAVQNVIDQLSKNSGINIPTLNCLCKKANVQLPSDGFDYVSPHYSELDDNGKRIFVEGLDSNAVSFEHWDWVLNELGLQPFTPFSSSDWELINDAKCHFGCGEGEEHKFLKQFIFEHPDYIGLKNVTYAEKERYLPSGDRLDVYFELADGTHIAVEVKPTTAPVSDIIRGAFQCLKYDAVMRAMRRLENSNYSVTTLLVTPQLMTGVCKRVAEELGVQCIDNFNM